MPVYKFNRNDVYVNTLKTYPQIKYFVYNGEAYYNDVPNISGSLTSSVRCTTPGNISLFELNTDRSFIPAVDDQTDKYITVVTDDDGVIQADKSIRDTGLIYQFMVKDSTRLSFSSTTSTAFGDGVSGDIFIGTLPYTSSITKEFYSTTTARSVAPTVVETEDDGLSISDYGSVSHLLALKNTLNYYTALSPHYAYSSSLLLRDLDNVQVGLINVPTIFYGSKIKPGTVKLDFYLTGSLIGRLQDTNHDGVLRQTAPGSSSARAGLGNVAGVILYNEGFLVLTGSWDLTNGTHTEAYGGTDAYPNWVNFAASLPGKGISAVSSSFLMEMSGTSKIQTLTMFTSAPKGALNQSSNPTFINYTTAPFGVTSSMGYTENQNLGIKNIVSSAYNTPTASFERTTYVCKVGIYDQNMNLIAIAKPATPIKKTSERDFTFKIELDI